MYSGKTLCLKSIENGFAEINFDNQSGSVNVFNQETLADLHQAVRFWPVPQIFAACC